MLRQYRLLPQILVDCLLSILAMVLADRLLPWLEFYADAENRSPQFESFAPVGLACLPFFIMLLYLIDLYGIPKHQTPFQTLRSQILAGVLATFLYVLARLFMPETLAPPLRALLMSGIIVTLLMWLARTGWPEFYGRPTVRRRTLIVGAHTHALRALDRHTREHPDEMSLLGIVDDFKSGVLFDELELPYYGDQSVLSRVVRTHQPNTVVVLHDQQEYADSVIKLIEEQPSIQEVYVRSHIPLFMAQDIEILFVQEVPLLKVFSRSQSGRRSWSRDMVDKAIAFAGLVVATPVLLLMSVLIKLESRGPVFYRQRRLGLGNQPFWIIKFRSMVVNAEKLSGAVLAEKNDPRVTRIGRLMRATRIDEIPQLINVLKGEMSMIGPRPERPEFIKSYLETIPWYPLRALCKPGLTGLAQVSGDYHTSTQRKLLYDVSYLANMSPVLDLRILFATVVTVLTKKGH